MIKQTHIGSLYAPAHVAAACSLTTITLRGWANGSVKGLDEPLSFEGEVGPNGRRSYRLADAILVFLAARLSGADGRWLGFMQSGEAVRLANAIAPFVRSLDRQYAQYGREGIVQMDEAGPMAIVTRSNARHGKGWNVAAFNTRADYQAAVAALSPGYRPDSSAHHFYMPDWFRMPLVALSRPGLSFEETPTDGE